MEQRVLTIDLGGETVVSKPWDFEAMCLVDDAKQRGEGQLRMGQDAVFYLFEGTKATDEVLNGLPAGTLSQLAMRVFLWYVQDLADAAKNA